MASGKEIIYDGAGVAGKIQVTADKYTLDELDARVRSALRNCGQKAVDDAKETLKNKKHKQTGLLVNSVAYSISGEEASIKTYKADEPDKNGIIQKGEYNGTETEAYGGKYVLYVGSKVFYAPYIECGTPTFKGDPYLKPAIANNGDKFRKTIHEELNG